MKNKIGADKLKIIYLVSAIIIIILTYLLIYQKNMEEASQIDTKNKDLTKRIEYLDGLQVKVSEMEVKSQSNQQEMEKYLSSFAPKLTQEKSIYHIYKMMVKTGIKVKTIEMENPYTFFNDAKVVLGTTSVEEETSNEEQTEEKKNEKKSIDQMKGQMVDYTIDITGSYKKIMDALDWITNCEEKMSVGSTSLAYDSSSGELSGMITIHFYSLEGNGVNYIPPNISGIKFGVKNLFGTKTK